MSEPFIERLSRFTPDVGGLDRDTLLFSAGRASARPNRRWMGLCAVLASTQLLVVLWPHSSGVAERSPGPIVEASAPQQASELVLDALPASSHVWSVRHKPDDTQFDNHLASSVVLVESTPTLRAFGPLPSSIVN